jgi:hypothetical protein
MLQMKRSKRKIEEIRKIQEFVNLERLDDYSHYQEIAQKTGLSVGKVKGIIEDFRAEVLFRKNNT